MNGGCPVCHLGFAREPGYFVGAMYVSYAVAVVIIGAIAAVISYGLFPGWPFPTVMLAAALIFLPLVPAVFRYSRVIWIHFDRYVDPES